MGGPEKIKRQHDGGKLTVRERVEGLLDPGSFHEIGTLAGKAEYDAEGRLAKFTPANLVIGRGLIDGRRVVVAGDDFTVRGGANDGAIKEKLVMSEMMAHELKLPIVRLVDGTGGGGSVKNIEIVGHTLLPGGFDGRRWDFIVRNLETVPTVALALGSVAGLGAARVAASHYSVMVKESSQMFVAGPPVVARIGRKMEKNELGGSHIHTQERRRGRRGRERAGGLREGAALSFLPAAERRAAAAAGTGHRRPEPARRMAARGDPAQPAAGLPDAEDRRDRRGPGTASSRSDGAGDAPSSPGSRA